MKVAASLPLCATAANQQSEAGHQEPQSEWSVAGARRRDFAARTGIDEVTPCPRPSDGLGGELGIGARVRLWIRLCFGRAEAECRIAEEHVHPM